MIRPDDTENDQWRDDIARAETLVRECGPSLQTESAGKVCPRCLKGSLNGP